MRETTIVARFQFQRLRQFVLILQLGLPVTVVDIHRSPLQAVSGGRSVVEGRVVAVSGGIVHVPFVERHRGVKLMGSTLIELVIIDQFGIEHTSAPVTRIGCPKHSLLQFTRGKDAIVIGRHIVVGRFAVKSHPRQREVVVVRQVECQSGTSEESATAVVVVAFDVHERILQWIFLLADTATATSTATISQVGIGIDPLAGVIDVAAEVVAAMLVAPRL